MTAGVQLRSCGRRSRRGRFEGITLTVVGSHETLVLSKLDAARRQLETAIILYFQEGDIVAVHTLACAAHEILETLNRKQGGKPTLKQSWENDIKPEYVKKFYRRLNAAKNFFKHADRDANQSIRFSPFESEVVILDASWTYRRLTTERLPLLGTFEMWAAITWAKEFLTHPGLNPDAPVPVRWAGMSRQTFFAELLPIATVANVTPPPSAKGAVQGACVVAFRHIATRRRAPKSELSCMTAQF